MLIALAADPVFDIKTDFFKTEHVTEQLILRCMPETGTAIDAVWQRGVFSNCGFGTSEVADLMSGAAKRFPVLVPVA